MSQRCSHAAPSIALGWSDAVGCTSAKCRQCIEQDRYDQTRSSHSMLSSLVNLNSPESRMKLHDVGAISFNSTILRLNRNLNSTGKGILDVVMLRACQD